MNAQHNDSSLSSFNTFEWPLPDGWEHHRKTIEKLYVDEDKTLKEVMSIMAKQYGHKGTMKMYKYRIAKWGLDKNHKASDVAHLLRKKTQRDAINKPSAFRVRNKSVDMQDIFRYLGRKTAQGRDFRMTSPDVRTPPHISCRTPTPPLLPNVLDKDQQTQKRTHDDRQPQETVFRHIYRQNYVSNSSMDGGQQLVHPSQRGFLRGTGGEHSRYFDSQRQGVPSVISPPQVLLVPERLFATITSYFDGSFRKGTWILDENGGCVSRNALVKGSNTSLTFCVYCGTASSLINQQSPVKGCHLLSKAIALIPEMLRVEHPSTLENLINVILIIKELGLVDVDTMLLNHFYQMARIVLSEDHPWFQISRLMALLDPSHHAAPFSQSWRCAIDAFGRALGRLSPSSISCQVEFIYRVYGTADPPGAERHLHKFLADCEQARESNDGYSIRILGILGHLLLEQGRFIEAEAMGQDMLAQANNIVRKVNALNFSAHAQYCLGKHHMAERNMRDVVKMVADLGEGGKPDLLRILIKLEGWLREWGRGDDADELEQEMAELIGPEDLDV